MPPLSGADQVAAILTCNKVAPVCVSQHSLRLEDLFDAVEIPAKRGWSAGLIGLPGFARLIAKGAHHRRMSHGDIEPHFDDAEADECDQDSRQKPQQDLGKKGPHTVLSLCSSRVRQN